MSTPPVEQDVDGNPSPEQILQSLADYINSDLVEVYPEECGPVPQTVTFEFWNCYVDFVNPFPFDDYEKSKEISEFANSFPSEIASELLYIINRDHFFIQGSYTGLSSTFHRLLFGLSIADILSSFWLMLSTLMSPTYTSGYIWNPRGNVHSCDTQGFFLFLGIMGAPLYNCSLCFYYLAVVKFNKKDAFIRKKLEPFFHAVPILVSVTGAIIILAKESFNANGSYCWINERNSYCEIESVSCERGKDVKILFSIFAVGPIIILPIVIVTTMVVMYREVIKIEKKLSKYGVGALRQNLGDNKKNDHQSDDANSASNKKSTIQRVRVWWTNLWPFNKSSARPSRSNNSRLQSRVILHKAILYSLAFLCTYIFPFVTSIQYWAEYQTSSTLKILASTCFPLQGFFNFLVFIHPKVTNKKRTKKLSWFQSFVTALKSRGDKNKNGGRSQLRSGGKKSKSKTSQNTTAVDAPRFRQKRKKMIFNRQPARRKKCRNRKFIADTQ